MASKGISTLAKPRWISAAPIAGTDVIIKITDRKRHGRVEYVVRAGKPLPGGRLALVGKDKVFATKPEADAWFSHLLKQTMQDDSFGGIVSHTGADKTIEADDVAWDDEPADVEASPSIAPQRRKTFEEAKANTLARYSGAMQRLAGATDLGDTAPAALPQE